MKKLLYILTVCLFASHINTFAQDDNTFHLHAIYPTASGSEIKESFTDSDSITTEYFKKCALKLLSNGKDVWKKQGDPFLTSYEIKLYNKGKEVTSKSPNSWAGTQNRFAEMPDKIIIDNVQCTKTVDGKKVIFFISSITLYKAVGMKNKKSTTEEFPLKD